MSWNEIKFASLYEEPSRNGIYKPKKFHGTGAKIVNMGELFAHEFIGPQDMKRLEVDQSERSRFCLNEGDLLFARRSLIESGAGKCVLVRGLTEETVFESSIIRVRLNCKKSNPRFYMYYFKSHLGRPRIEAIITGTAQKGIRGSELAEITVHAPPLNRQNQIASILSAYDDLIENNLCRIKILEEMAQNLYREWFVEFRFPGHENVRMVDSELGKVPEGWEPLRLGDVAEQVRRNIHPQEVAPDTRYVGLEHLPRQSITIKNWSTADTVESNKLSFCRDEILFCKIRPYLHKVAVAPFDGICSGDTIVIRPVKPEVFAAVLSCVSSEEFVAHATQTSQGTKMPRANWDVLRQYPLPLPPVRLLEKFSQTVNTVVQSARNLMFKNRVLRETRDLLLPKLISGELDVSELYIADSEEAA